MSTTLDELTIDGRERGPTTIPDRPPLPPEGDRPEPGGYRCQICNLAVTVGPTGTEYGHMAAGSGDTERCPRRPGGVDPSGPGGASG